MAAGGPCDDATTAVGVCDDLSILCVTRYELATAQLVHRLSQDAARLGAQMVWAADSDRAFSEVGSTASFEPGQIVVRVESRGYVESVLDEALAATTCPFILRIDDDEQISPAMFRWLERGEYREEDHWQFPRQQMWECPSRRIGCLMTPHLYPDFQTRLSVRSMAGGRSGVHAPSPHGGGEIAPVALWHWKFVVRTREDRRRIAQTYDAYSPGYGTGNMLPFSLPEEAYETMTVVEAGDGKVPWEPKWSVEVDNSQFRQETQGV